MSDSESINSEEIPSDNSSSSSEDNNPNSKKQEKALSNLKNTLNIDDAPKNNSPKKNLNQNSKNQNIYYTENSKITEDNKNVHTTKNQKISFTDVFKTFQGEIKNETAKANLSRAVKNFGISENPEEKNKKSDINNIKKNYEEAQAEKLLERNTNYLSLNKEITSYQNKVKSLREADVIDFTQENKKNTRSIGKKSLKEIASTVNNISKKEKNKNSNEFDTKINDILIKNKCISDDKILEAETQELKNINPEELKRRYNELKQLRMRLLQKEIENKRKAKIKSKLYHKIQKNKKIKEENMLLEQLEQIDPEAVQEYLDKKKIDRVQERMQLKHSLNSKFQKTIKRYHFDRDQQVKEAIKDNFQLRDKLLQKIQGKENENENEENEISENENEEIEEKEEEYGLQKNNEGNVNMVLNFENKNKEIKKNDEKEKNEKLGVFSMPFMKNAENDDDIQNKIEKLKNKMIGDDNKDDYDNLNLKEEESSDSDNEKKNTNKKNNNNKKSVPVITKANLKQIDEDAKKINENNEKSKKVDIKFDADTLQKMIDEENMNEDVKKFNNFLIENDINKKEFLENENQEKLDKIKKDNPEFTPGWGSWAGDDNQIKAKEFLRKKRYEEKINRLKEQASEGDKNKFVKISQEFDKNFSNYLVKELPNDMQNREQYEKYNKTLIGREVNSLNLYKKLIQPKVVKKIGQIINPMTANDATKGMKIQEIIEKVTKKKKYTKAKL